jgi:hypothetical protein
MSIFKSFLTSDAILSPFGVNKSFSFQTSEFTLSNTQIDRYYGINLNPSLWISGSYPTGQINIQDQILIYHSIKELYYSNYLSGSNGSPVATASFNLDGTITGAVQTPNYYNYLSSTLPANRYFPTGSGDQIGVFTIPSNLYGEYLNPGSVVIVDGVSNISLVDDGNGNLTSGSIDSQGNYIPSTTKYGDVIYEHGIITLTSASTPLLNELITGSASLAFVSNITLYESQYKCTIRENEFNFTQNPTAISGSPGDGILYDFITGSYFAPYITTIGLYNNNYDLIAVAKLAQPLPTSAVTDTTILINLDL